MRIQVDKETLLRIPEPSDADEFYAVIDRNREYLGEWLDFIPETTGVEVTRGVIERWQKSAQEESAFNFVIEYRGKIVGSAGFSRLKEPRRRSELGYWLAEEMQGRGIMTGCCRAMLKHLFEERNLNRVEIRIAVSNKKSRAIPERLGFTQEGVLRQTGYHGDDYSDMAVYSMLAREYSGN